MQMGDGDIHKPVRIIVVDDHWVFRQGVCAVLEPFRQRVQVVGEASTAEDAVQMTQQRTPDLVLLDLRLPQRLGVLARPSAEHGLRAIGEIAALARPPRVLVLSYLDDPSVLFEALRAGAHGYITKGDPYDGEALVEAITRTMAGEAFYGAMVAQLIRDYHQQRNREPSAPAEPLTPRELEVLELLVDRKTNQEIADTLVISVKTVKTHVANILAKLHLDSRHEIPTYVRFNRRENLA
jgi:NarL family two-component system response regulator LiaR